MTTDTPATTGAEHNDGDTSVRRRWPVDHPDYRIHLAALRSINRSVEDAAGTTTGRAVGPQDARVAAAGIRQLLRLKPLVITGAGISTDSGIPDYRGPRGSLREHRPMTYQEFKYDPRARHRYWARSFVGWHHLDRAAPNAGHRVLADWNAARLISGIVTQNVDGLHQLAAAGTADPEQTIITLHGDMSSIICLSCGAQESRAGLDQRFRQANPGFLDRAEAVLDSREIKPDGDANLPEEFVAQFQMVQCLNCGAEALKPEVVYFGEAVPAERKVRISRLLERSGAVLVVGSSLAVMSSYKIVLDARKARKPVGIINGGPSRGDARATYRWRTSVSEALEWLEESL